MSGRSLVLGLACLGMLPPAPARGEVKVEKIAYLNLPNCYRLSNGTVEVIVTTDVGPRIIRYGFVGGENMLAELPPADKSDPDKWNVWGGHRLWTAPEAMPRSYAPDNSPVEHRQEGPSAVRLTQPVERTTGVQKEIVVTLAPQGSDVTILHRLTNRNLWAIELAPWALTVMRGGGTAIVPQEPYRSHDEALLPARPMTLWSYTNLADPRWQIGPKYIRLSTDTSRKESQKVGVANKVGWAAYALGGTLFVKRIPYEEGATYPDFGSNTEVYTAADFLEVESLGPMRRLEPNQSTEHLERWTLFKNVQIGKSEQDVDAALRPVLASLR